jgi:class 3 adenylate cyclase
VVETAGDGLMVLFHTGDAEHHALEAVRAAQTIMAKTCQVNFECRLDSHPIVINIGICSGRAFVGAFQFFRGAFFFDKTVMNAYLSSFGLCRLYSHLRS